MVTTRSKAIKPYQETEYEINCTIAREIIEERLGIPPTPERIQTFVDFITAFEKDIKKE